MEVIRMYSSTSRGLQVRMAVALALSLVGYVALFGLVLHVLATPLAVVACALVALAIVMGVQYADRIAYWTTKAVAIDHDQHPLLFDTTDRVARQADVPRPSVAVIPSEEPNALSAGTGSETVLCVTTGLLRALDEDELEAVIAHELAHLKNRDSTVMTVAGFPMALSVLMLVLTRKGFSLLGIVLSVPFWIACVLLVVAVPIYVVSLPGTVILSRYREYAADRGAVAITGKPFALASALATIHDADDVPDEDLRRIAGFNAFCIVPTGSMTPVSLHPPTHKRIRQLRKLQEELA